MDLQTKLVVIMVGLPARGKSFLAAKLQRYLAWQGYKIKIFNAGNYRREILGDKFSGSDFFNPNCEKFSKQREEVAKKCFSNLIQWLKNNGEIAIYDATNVTPKRRNYLAKECQKSGLDYIFIENICDNQKIIDEIIGIKIKNSADYEGKDEKWAKKDFEERLRHYEKVYESMSEIPYIKIFNFGERIEKNFDGRTNIFFDELAEFLGNLRFIKKNVYLTRHGETFFNLENKIGGDSLLTDSGVEYAKKLADYFNDFDLTVFISPKTRTIKTAEFLKHQKIKLEELSEINSGICDSLSYEEIAEKFPKIYLDRKNDKFNFCYPKGESYKMLIQRIKKVIFEVERQDKNVVIIAHRAVNRCLFSYFIETAQNDIPHIEMPLNKIIKITPNKAFYNFEILEF
ncbi:histidine phosphatase family protein [Candidatus Wolfebacteria bacterium]|nr:histidine phosphatase family protein [Candidatus Wolfebacteria bacterium]